MIPAFAVVIKANKAAIDMAMKPGVPIMIFEESAIGVSELMNVPGSNTPTVTISIRVYNIVTATAEVIIPSGIFFWGFFTSSEMLATFNNPPKEIKINPAVEKTGLTPSGVKGVKFEVSIFGNPRMVYKSIRISKPITRVT